MVKEIDKRYELHSKQLATRGDVEAVRRDIEVVRADLAVKIENLRSDMFKSMAETQRWTIVAIGIIVALVAAIQKLIP